MALHVVSAILFYPRGGSAHAARALAEGLRLQGCQVTLVSGSRRDLGAHGNAREFYGDVRAVDFDAALASAEPMRYEGPPGTAPMQPSFEDRAGAPDRAFAMLDDLDYECQVGAWSRELDRAGAAQADVLHLHHLTPLNEAAMRVAPHVPVIGHLHGTELLMLEQIDLGAPLSWRHATGWAGRLRTWAQRCSRLIAAPAGVDRAAGLLEVPRDRFVALPSGVDAQLFTPREIDRRRFWRRVLVEQPQGWLPDQPPGSIRYDESEAAQLASGTVLLSAGRYTAVKRLDQLVNAFSRAQGRLNVPTGLVLLGGYAGEWEGEHPAELVARVGVEQVYLAGWHAHEALPQFFSASDAVIAAAEREQFGQVLIEGMACERPSVAVRSLGPAQIIEDGRTGWLVNPENDAALTAAIVEAVEDPSERERRGKLARAAVRERFSWDRISAELAAVLRQAALSAPARGGLPSR